MTTTTFTTFTPELFQVAQDAASSDYQNRLDELNTNAIRLIGKLTLATAKINEDPAAKNTLRREDSALAYLRWSLGALQELSKEVHQLGQQELQTPAGPKAFQDVSTYEFSKLKALLSSAIEKVTADLEARTQLLPLLNKKMEELLPLADQPFDARIKLARDQAGDLEKIGAIELTYPNGERTKVKDLFIRAGAEEQTESPAWAYQAARSLLDSVQRLSPSEDAALERLVRADGAIKAHDEARIGELSGTFHAIGNQTVTSPEGKAYKVSETAWYQGLLADLQASAHYKQP